MLPLVCIRCHLIKLIFAISFLLFLLLQAHSETSKAGEFSSRRDADFEVSGGAREHSHVHSDVSDLDVKLKQAENELLAKNGCQREVHIDKEKVNSKCLFISHFEVVCNVTIIALYASVCGFLQYFSLHCIEHFKEFGL